VTAYRIVGLEVRQLQTLDPRRMPLLEWRKAVPDLKECGQELTLPASKLIASNSEVAVDQALTGIIHHWRRRLGAFAQKTVGAGRRGRAKNAAQASDRARRP